MRYGAIEMTAVVIVSGDSSVVERWNRDRKVAGSSPRGRGSRIFLRGQLSVLTLISVSVPPP